MRTDARFVVLLAGLVTGVVACVQDVPLPRDLSPDGPSPGGVSPGGVSSDAGTPDGGTPALRPRDAMVSCQEIDDFRQENPQVIVALDRSASMWQKYDGSAFTRLEEAQRILQLLMATYHDAVHTGYVEFPVTDCSAVASMGCCASRVISPAGDTLEAIQSRWRCDSQGSTCEDSEADAPAAAALRNARQHFADEDEDDVISSRHVFLLTDSEPSCSSRPATECNQSITEAARLWGNEGVVTDVFVLSEEVMNSSCLQSIAGVRQDSNGPSRDFHVSPNPTALLAQLEERLATVSQRACTFRLSSPVRPPGVLTLYLGDGSKNVTLPRDPLRKDGWEFEQESVRRFTVYGPWCEALRTSQVQRVNVEICTPDRPTTEIP